ncbi:MAG: hypothetical protein GEU79_07195 [Acidimicrobiia bacterium]|nr:hypothetical protein [Acidimicrobiia bacterium]
MLEILDHPLGDREARENLEDSELLGGLQPGPEMAAVLGRIDRSPLNGYQLVWLLEAWERQVAHCQAEFTDNLAPLCRHDHRLKHETQWELTTTSGGTHQWTSPQGHTYQTGRSP